MIEAHGLIGREGQPPALAPDDAPETAPDRAPDPAPDPATPQESPTDAAEQALCAALEGFNTQDPIAAEPVATPAPASTAPSLQRKSARDLHRLTDAIADCLRHNLDACDPEQIARDVLAAGRLAQVEYEFRRSLPTDEFRERDQDDQRRMERGSDRYWRLKRKAGTAKAGQAILDLWNKPLSYWDRQRKTERLPRLRRERVVTAALLTALSDGLGRPLRFSGSRTGGPDIRALVTAWTILHGDPDESLPVQRPGSARWFKAAIREQRQKNSPLLPKNPGKQTKKNNIKKQ